MEIGDETLSAYLDGELTGEEREAVEQALARSPDLAERLQRLDTANARASAVFGEIDERALPEGVRQMLAPSAVGASARLHQARRARLRALGRRIFAPGLRPWAMPAAAALALVVGYVSGLTTGGLAPEPTRTALLDQTAGVIGESHPLHRVLQRAPSGESRALGETGEIEARPALSFRSEDGRYCRDLAVIGGERASRGVFCRGESGAWQLETLVAAKPAGDGYRPAAGAPPQAIQQTVDRLIAGAPLDLQAESQAIEQGWRPKE